MTIWIDGDSCHRSAMRQIFAIVPSRNIPVRVVADRSLDLAGRGVEFVLVPHGSGAVDSTIVDGSHPGDIAVTRDFELISRLLSRGLTVLDDRGTIWSASLLQKREVDDRIRQAMRRGGMNQMRSRNYGSDEEMMFARSLQRVLKS